MTFSYDRSEMGHDAVKRARICFRHQLMIRFHVSPVRAVIFAALAAACCAQTFEVASIRPHKGEISTVGVSIDGTLVTGEAMAVRDLVSYAYDLQNYQVFGVPLGVDVKERYDISARVPGEMPTSPAQIRPMLQTLLDERFQLKFHREMRDVDIYALVVAKGGAKLRENSASAPRMITQRNGITSTGTPMSMLASQLGFSPGFDRPVLDKTELGGTYDFQLNFAIDPKDGGLTGPGGESIFTALEEQLGLRLEKRKAPIEVLVVDSVQKPSEN